MSQMADWTSRTPHQGLKRDSPLVSILRLHRRREAQRGWRLAEDGHPDGHGGHGFNLLVAEMELCRRQSAEDAAMDCVRPNALRTPMRYPRDENRRLVDRVSPRASLEGSAFHKDAFEEASRLHIAPADQEHGQVDPLVLIPGQVDALSVPDDKCRFTGRRDLRSRRLAEVGRKEACALRVRDWVIDFGGRKNGIGLDLRLLGRQRMSDVRTT